MWHIQTIILILATASLSGCLATAMYVNGKIDCAAAPDKVPPKQRYEFPFRLVYEEEGRQFSVADTQVCQFAGNECINGGREMVWKESFASGRKELLIQSRDGGEVHELSLCSCALQVHDIECSFPSPASHLTAKAPDQTQGARAASKVRAVSFEQDMAEARDER